jgi:hypothetical protein
MKLGATGETSTNVQSEAISPPMEKQFRARSIFEAKKQAIESS